MTAVPVPAPEAAATGLSVVVDEEHGQSDLVLGSCCFRLR